MRKSSPGESGPGTVPAGGFRNPSAEVDKPAGVVGLPMKMVGAAAGGGLPSAPGWEGMRRWRAGRSVFRAMSPTLACLLIWLSACYRGSKQKSQLVCCRCDLCPPVLGRPLTHLLHLVDAVSSPVIFGLLLRDTGHNMRLRAQPQAQPPALCHTDSPETSPSSPFSDGRRRGNRRRRSGRI